MGAPWGCAGAQRLCRGHVGLQRGCVGVQRMFVRGRYAGRRNDRIVAWCSQGRHVVLCRDSLRGCAGAQRIAVQDCSLGLHRDRGTSLDCTMRPRGTTQEHLICLRKAAVWGCAGV